MELTGELIAATRRKLGLSRAAFAQRVGLSPGAGWRVEVKGVFKPGEAEQIQAAVGDVLATVRGELPPSVLDLPVAEIQRGGVASPLPASKHVSVPLPAPSKWPPASALTGGEASFTFPITSESAPALKLLAGGDLPTVPPKPEPQPIGLPELSPHERFLADGIRRITNSEVQTFKRCRRKWYLTYYRGYRSKVESPVGARATGDRVHRALRWHYNGDPSQRVDAREALEHVIVADRAAIIARYAPEPPPLALVTKMQQEADLERLMVEGYLEWLRETGADSEYQVIGSEQYVEVDLPDTLGVFHPGAEPVRLVARLDARLRRTSDGVRLFMDHKTVGGFAGPLQSLALNEQMLWYILVEQLLTPNERVDGALYNMLRRTKRTVKAQPPFYMRVEVRHNFIEVNNFHTRTAGTIAEIQRLRAALDADVDHRVVAYPTPAGDCTWSCPFQSVDSLIDDGSHWESMLNAFFTVGDPTDYYKKIDTVQPVAAS